MTTYAHKLEASNLSAEIPVHVLTVKETRQLNLDDPAISAMTDLKQNRAITVNPYHKIDFAQQLMKQAGVRLLVVVNEENIMVGLVTARDITGEKPLKIMSTERTHRDEITVSQVMTQRERLDAFIYEDIINSSVREVVVNLRNDGRQHGIVFEKLDDGDYFLRGIFSITQIARQLGVDIQVDSQVQSFAELEQLIA